MVQNPLHRRVRFNGLFAEEPRFAFFKSLSGSKATIFSKFCLFIIIIIIFIYLSTFANTKVDRLFIYFLLKFHFYLLENVKVTIKQLCEMLETHHFKIFFEFGYEEFGEEYVGVIETPKTSWRRTKHDKIYTKIQIITSFFWVNCYIHS